MLEFWYVHRLHTLPTDSYLKNVHLFPSKYNTDQVEFQQEYSSEKLLPLYCVELKAMSSEVCS